MEPQQDDFTERLNPSPGGNGTAGRRRWVAAIALGAVCATLGGLAATLFVKSPAQAAAEAAAPPPSVLTAPVERRVLTSSVITRGEVVAEQMVEVTPRGAAGEGGTGPVITKIPVHPGDAVRAGQVLMEVSGRPVFTLEGTLPVYRDLRPGATGDDVRQLQRALRKIGHDTAPDTAGSFGAGTKNALGAFYASLGYDPVPAHATDGDPVAEARLRVTSSERALEDAEDALRDRPAADAEAPASGAAPEGAASASAGTRDGDGGLQKAVIRAREDLAAARTALAAAEAASGPTLPAAEVVFLKGFPARVDAVIAKAGGEATGTAMTLSSGKLVVQAYVPEYQKDLIRTGHGAEIYSEVTGTSAKGRVTSVTDRRLAAGSADGQEQGEGGGSPQDGNGSISQGGAGWLVGITPSTPLKADLTGQDVRVTVIAASTDGEALVVPITAISSGADGRTTVTVVEADGDRRQVEIRTGTAGDGFVAVTPETADLLAEGDRVITGTSREGNTP
ncbi:peptidoglycan-binding domain-containing protein [Streptomyces sp. NPDC035033]|uniref:peptidoglycan-binding domain-containing protein n=1 Tax=Streptomyces sp. NPDC035033 TaxID=3155368 RepID=UPI0033F2B13E